MNMLRISFDAGKCIPITRGGGIYQEHMNEALERLKDGSWVSCLAHFEQILRYCLTS